jgi:hypothetical protein
MMKFKNYLLVPLTIAAAVSACDSSTSDDSDNGDTGGAMAKGGGSGTGGTGAGTGGSGATDPTGTVLHPSSDGWMDRMDAWNDIGAQGSWYPYGDQYGTKPTESKCLTVGMHPASECSEIDFPPPPPATGFPQDVAEVMCTRGRVSVILPCVAGVTTSGCPEHDYSNMWGAGMGFDLNADKGEEGGAKRPWDPLLVTTGPIIGFSFDIDNVPLPKLRVEIPMLLTDAEAAAVTPTPLPPGSTTDDHPDGAPYWGASSSYPASPVMPGNNRVTWADIHPPRTNYVFDTARMLGVQFHVPAVAAAPKGEYDFCISNVKMLRM